MTTVQTKAWTGRNGQTRYYVQNLGDLAEDMYSYDLGRRNYDRAQGSKIWLDESGQVHVDSWGLSFSGAREADIVAYIEAHLPKREQETTEAVEQVPAGAQRVYSPVYGGGIRYADQPGATQYQSRPGHYDVQIWDQA